MSTALLISGIGMGLLCAALVAFWGLLALMTWQRRPAPRAPEAAGTDDAPARAAAAAVAVALALAGEGEAPVPGQEDKDLGGLGGPGQADGPSAWWRLHHARRLRPPAGRSRWG